VPTAQIRVSNTDTTLCLRRTGNRAFIRPPSSSNRQATRPGWTPALGGPSANRSANGDQRSRKLKSHIGVTATQHRMCAPIGRAGGGSGRAEQGVPKRAGGGIPLISVGSTHLIMTGWIGRFQLSRIWICALLFLLPGHFGSACVDSLIGHDRMFFAGFSGRLS
jgi:hypothetical protein